METADQTVLIVDDNADIRKTLVRAFERAGWHARAEGTPKLALDRLRESDIAVMIVDLKLPGMSGLELQGDVCATKYPLPFVFITGHGNIPMSVKAMKKGAVDFLIKPFDDEQLLDAIKKALKKDEKSLADLSEQEGIALCLDTLTEREREVLTYLIAGMLNKQVAYELDIAERTVKAHRKQIFEKMKVGSIAELVRLTEKAGFQPFKTDQS